MKRIVLASIFCFYLGLLFGQHSIPFPTVNTTWMSKEEFIDPWNPNTSYWFDKTDGDTIINNLNYTIINRLEGYDCYFRQTPGMVYCKYDVASGIDTTEFLLYNFNLQVGEKMPLAWAEYELLFDTCEVIAIDSLLVDGVYRKHFWLQGLFRSLDYVEGIGSLEALRYPDIPWVDWITNLECFSQDDRILDLNGSGNSQAGNCWQFVGEPEPLTEHTCLIPNPAQAATTITAHGFAKAEVYQCTGNLLLETTNQQLNLTGFKKGLYVVKIFMHNGSQQVVKLAVN